jgi:hypothetical protein
MEYPIKYIPNDLFDSMGFDKIMDKPMPGMDEWISAPSYRGDFMDSHIKPVLTREQETHLFLQLNFFKRRANRANKNRHPKNKIKYENKIKDITDILVKSNIALVISMIKFHSSPELMSEVMLIVLRCINAFDVKMGNKLSTLLTIAIRREMPRMIQVVESPSLKGFHRVQDYYLEEIETRQTESTIDQKEKSAIVQNLLTKLHKLRRTRHFKNNRNEQTIICRNFVKSKYGIKCKKMFETEMVKKFKISRETIRLLDKENLDFFKKIVQEEQIDLETILS